MENLTLPEKAEMFSLGFLSKEELLMELLRCEDINWDLLVKTRKITSIEVQYYGSDSTGMPNSQCTLIFPDRDI